MKRVLTFLSPYRLWLLAAVVGTALGAMSELFLPALLADIVGVATAGGAESAIVRIGLQMLLMTAITVVASALGGYFSAKATAAFSRDLRSGVFEKVQRFSQAEMNRFGPASLITRSTNDVLQVQNFVLMFLRIIVRAPVLLVGGVAMAYTKSPALARPLIFSAPLILLIIATVSRFVMPLFKVYQERLDAVNLVLREQIHGIRVIRAFGGEQREEQRFDTVNRDMTATGLKMMRTMSAMMPLLMTAMNFTVVAIIWIGGIRAGTVAGMQTGDLLAVIQYVMQIMFSLVMMSMVFVMYPRAQASADRIGEILGTKPTINDPAQPQSPGGRGAASVEFRDVSFTFPGAERPALEHLTFRADKGETVAFIGSTGSGKSTLFNLIMRFYDVGSGSVVVDGIDVRDYAQSDLRARIGYIPQQSHLFSGTVADNLHFGRPDAGEEEMTAAAGVAQALDFIGQRDGGFESEVSQGGGNLSGGQRQRLAIARAAIREPEIYLFDDSFSALDFATDAALRRALKAKTADATVLIVAQRVATIMDADRIVVLDSGRIAGIGTHRELVQSCDIYAEIVSSQFSEGEVAI